MDIPGLLCVKCVRACVCVWAYGLVRFKRKYSGHVHGLHYPSAPASHMTRTDDADPVLIAPNEHYYLSHELLTSIAMLNDLSTYYVRYNVRFFSSFLADLNNRDAYPVT